MSDTIAAVATGAQVSAIGIVRLSGETAIDIAAALFHPAVGGSVANASDRTLVYGELRDTEGRLLDICMCTVSRAPHSYTGEDTAEFQCHGSPAVLRELLRQTFSLGARQALPGEFTKRAFLNGKLELSAAEAVADLIDAETAECVRNAAGQLSGAIARRVETIYSALTDICAHYHAVLDYPDEDIEDFSLHAYKSTICAAAGSLRALLSTFDRGRLMSSGIPTAIVGRPNAGKSSLLNALVGYERAIVTSIPGTTRDTIEEKLRLGGIYLRLTDTAGIRDTFDEVERMGVERSRRAIEDAQLVIAVVDASVEYTPDDAAIIAAAERAPHGVVVQSKNDISAANLSIDTSLPIVSLSAVTGDGIDKLENVISGLFPLPDVPAGEILTNARQADAAGRALDYISDALDAMERGLTPDIALTVLEGAMDALGELSGRTVREDVTERIFQRFCVGK